MARTDPQLNLRLPTDLKDQLEAAAEQNNRSVTAETVARLSSSFSTEKGAAFAASAFPFLLARMEMRAAEAELDNVQLQAMTQELAWSLRGAMLAIAAGLTKNDPEIVERFADWNNSIQSSLEYLGEDGQNKTVDELSEHWHVTSEAKIDELEKATEKAKLLFAETKKIIS